MNKTFVDHLGRRIEVCHPPKSIVSLVPSVTELLYHLGLGNEVKGVTKFCVHPEKVKASTIEVGGTKNFKMDQIHQIAPDLIIANKEENYIDGIIELEKKYPVWVGDVNTYKDALSMISDIGEISDKVAHASRLIGELNEKWGKIKKTYSGSVLYLIWYKPSMVAGNNTFINSILDYLGFTNVANKYDRYPELSSERLYELNPEFVFLSSEPFPFKEKHLGFYQSIFPKSKIILVDGEMFSWYGSRMLFAPDYFKVLFN